MAYSGHSITSSSGAYVPPTIEESERTATKANIAINLNVQYGVDSVDTNHQTKVTEDELKYQSQASRPLLPPVHQMRTSGPQLETKPDESWKGIHDDLVEELPDDLKSFFLEQMQLKPSERHPSIEALNQAMIDAAKFIAALQAGAVPIAQGTAAEAQMNVNYHLPFIAKEGLIKAGGEAIKNLEDALNDVGANHPQFDTTRLSLDKLTEGVDRISQPIEDHNES